MTRAPGRREQRRHPRLALPARCWIGDGRHTIYMRVHDVSLGGLSVRAPVPFEPNAPVELRIELPGGRHTRARGEVVWVREAGARPHDGGPLMGARFTELLEGAEHLYKALGPA